MATSRRVATNENISTYGLSRDYSSMATWEAATDIDLVSATQSEVLECYDDAAEFDESVELAGATTNASYFRIIRPAGTIGTGTWEGHDGTPNNGFKVHTTGSTVSTFLTTENFSSIQDIIVQSTQTGTGSTVCIGGNGDDNLFVGMILVDIVNGDNEIRACLFGGADQIAVNCIAIRTEAEAFLADGSVSYYLNCNAVDCWRGFDEFTTDPHWLNCLADNSTDQDFDGGAGAEEENNASSDGTATGTGSRINQTFTYINAAGDDYHLSLSDTGAYTFGQDLSSYTPFPFDDDIDGNTRS